MTLIELEAELARLAKIECACWSGMGPQGQGAQDAFDSGMAELEERMEDLRNQIARKEASMAEEEKEDTTVEEEEEVKPPKYTNALLTGASGSGKTTSAMTIIDPSAGETALHLDIDNRAESIEGFPGITSVPCYEEDPRSPKAWMKLEEIRKRLWTLVQKDEFPYTAVVADGMSSLYDVGMNWAITLNPKVGLGGAPAEHHWMPQMYNCKQWIKSMIALPCHFILTGHEDLEKNKLTGTVIWLPKCTGKNRTDTPRWFNETYFCWRKSGKKGQARYFWNTISWSGGIKRDYLKSSMNQLGRYWRDPVEIDFTKERVGFQDLKHRRYVVGPMPVEKEEPVNV
jgi:hypothetical protein